MTSNFDTKNNNCYVSCDNTYQSCFDACNGDPTCEAGCLATKNTCDSNCAATDYAGNVHNFLWGGSLYEPETNLYWMRNRYYHKDMHRFINQDPIGIWGDANNLGNGFAYVAGMVIEASDPTGLGPLDQKDGESDEEYQNRVDGMRRNTAKPSFVLEFAAMSVRESAIEDAKSFFGVDFIENLIEFQKNPNFNNGVKTWLALTSIGNLPKEAKDFAGKSVKALGCAIVAMETIQDGVLYKLTDKNGNIYYMSGDGTIYRCVNGQWQKLVYVGWFKWEWQDVSSPPPGYNKRPSDPDSIDGRQTYFMNQFLKKMLEVKDKKRFPEIMEEEGPFTEYIDENGKKIFVRNPYYRGKDPMEEILWRVQEDSGMWGFVRNPFAPGADTSKQKELRKLIESDGVIGPSIF
ncbi:MAG TPA: RHS repeat-associated core domain-containing protein [bacterium]|nr:RHS repeat-associated core domain-containing protein [bacterium]